MANESYGAICYDKGQECAAIALAASLRRMGIAVDMSMGGNAQKKFPKLCKSGAWFVVYVRDGNARLWRRWDKTINAPISDILSYMAWLHDDIDMMPEPPAYMLERMDDAA